VTGIAIGTGPLGAAALRVGGAGAAPPPPPPPPPTFARIVLEGDSITSTEPFQTINHDSFYSHTWADEHPAITSFVSAQGSRVVGGAAYNGDLADNATNALAAQVAADLALDPDLLVAKIGVNDLSSNGCQTATYLQRLRDWGTQIRAAGVKLAYASPTPIETGSEVDQAERDTYLAKWNALWATHDLRNPAVWGQWADYYIPLGEQPFFRQTTGWSSEGIHPSGPVGNPARGQFHLKAAFDAAMATLLDTSRVTASSPYENVWAAFGPFTDLAPGVPITRRVILSGLAWAGHAGGVSVSGGDAAVQTNGYAARAYAYNGDTVDLTFTPSASYETDAAIQLTLGGETRTLTYRTAANVAPAAYQHGDIVGVGEGDSALTLTGLTFAAGTAVVIVRAAESGPSAVTLDGIALTRRRREVAQYTGAIEIWDGPVAAGSNHTLAIAYPAWTSNRVVSYGTVVNGSFTSAAGNAPTSQSEPHLLPAVTLPANGIALAGFLEYGGATITPATANTGTTLLDEGRTVVNGETHGIALGSLAASGQVSFNFAFGSYPRVVAVYAAR
jgi:hypothetical protein